MLFAFCKFEHFQALWAFSRVVSIFITCEHFYQLWAFSSLVSIFKHCEDFHHLWAFSSIVRISSRCEHFHQLWAFCRSEDFWPLVSNIQRCKHLPSMKYIREWECLTQCTCWNRNAHKMYIPIFSFANCWSLVCQELLSAKLPYMYISWPHPLPNLVSPKCVL